MCGGPQFSFLIATASATHTLAGVQFIYICYFTRETLEREDFCVAAAETHTHAVYHILRLRIYITVLYSPFNKATKVHKIAN